jgi:hypothetical protein
MVVCWDCVKIVHFPPHAQRPQAAGGAHGKGGAGVEQIAVQMQANVRLQAVGEAFEHLQNMILFG